MTTAAEFTETVQDGILKAIETGQRMTLEAVSVAASTFDGILPERPAVPFTTTLATPQEALDAGFTFAERLLDSQKKFLTEMATIVVPATPAKKSA